MVKGVKPNPREVKRFINNIILAKSVFDKPTDELIVVQALSFHQDWNKFLDLITPDELRGKLLNEYKNLKQDKDVNAELSKIRTELYGKLDANSLSLSLSMISFNPSKYLNISTQNTTDHRITTKSKIGCIK
jgi:hypothetical protein